MTILIESLLSPICRILPVSLLIAWAGVFLIFRKKYRSGLITVFCGLLIIYTFSLFPVAGLILQPLQTKYRSYQAEYFSVRYVVVLGGWHKTNRQIPLSSQLSQDSLTRIVEAIGIYHQNLGSKLVLSGAPPKKEIASNAQMMAKMAILLGVPNEDIILEERPDNTESEVRFIKEIVRREPFVLVTSASHMPRAMKLFQRQGLTPLPAPVNFLILKDIQFSLIPSAVALQSSEKSLHEYLGMLWGWLRRRI